MAMRRVAGHVSRRLLKGREEVRNYFTDPFVLKVQDALKYEAQIVNREDYLQQKLGELKYEFRLHQKLSAEYKAKYGAAIKFQVFIAGSALTAFFYDIRQKHAYIMAL
ncbi:hypothetical protein MKW94_030889 [Papaver nudicaule]|uniref:Uncharacterized protein n=1 Tax=Papaver nudicaule TaxID=74823 RepID=A0AA41SAX8_PAPNU|nr:hypothetical protein [Papaver nudicaule]